MTSFDPREWIKKEENPVVFTKLPLQRLEPTLRKFTQVAIPTDLERLRRHQINIERYSYAEAWKKLNIEQINASRTVQQLKANMRELENTRLKIRDEDIAAFEAKILPIKKQAVDAISSFGDLQESLSDKCGVNSSDVSHIDREIVFNASDKEASQVQAQKKADEADAIASWDELRESLVDLNIIIRQFSEIVHQQHEKVDSIADNVDKSHASVREGTMQLGQANKLKAAMIPVAGACIGGLLGGPIGLIAGFKMAGVAAAVGGGFIGYQGGKMIRRKRDEAIDSEISNLSEENIPLNKIKDKNT